jgi:GT2 family glycosyltransferase
MSPSAPAYANDDLTVVIPHFGSYDLLRQCLSALSGSRVATVVVEDGCYDKGIRNEFPDVRFVTLSRNSGFAAACNRGLAEVATSCVAFLNNDVFVTANWQTPLLEALSRDEGVAVCQPKLLSAKNAGYFDYAGAAGGLMDRYAYPFCQGRIFDEVERDLGQYDSPREIFWASGAALVGRTGDIRGVGGFDENLFAFHEELDLCWRLRARGKKIVFVPESRVFHIGSATWDSMAFRRAYLLHRNGIIVLVKNCPRSQLGILLGGRYFLELASAGYFFVGGQPNRSAAVLMALAWNIWHFRATLRRYHSTGRQDVPRDLPPFVYPKSIAIAHFLGRINRFSQLKW